MQHYWSLDNVKLQDAWLAIGSFDGVHRGHQAIVRRMTAGAHDVGAPAVVLTFHPHPATVLGKRKGAFYLTTPEERANLLGEIGVDAVITLPFNLEVAAMSARDFVSLIHSHLGFRQLMVGPDFALGRGREGNVTRLEQLGEEFGYTLNIVQPVMLDDQVISSSLVRSYLQEGQVEAAANLLGRPFQVTGEVIHGDGRGRGLGIPTANLGVWPERMIPKPGVYVCQVRFQDRTYGAVTNVGYRPTFENQPPSPRVEAHLLEFDQDLYGHEVQLSFLARIRDELRFDSIDALLAQIAKDIALARETLLIYPPPSTL